MTSPWHPGHRASIPQSCVSARPLATLPTLLKGQFISRSQINQRAHISITGTSIDFPTLTFLLRLEFFCIIVYKTVLFSSGV